MTDKAGPQGSVGPGRVQADGRGGRAVGLDDARDTVALNADVVGYSALMADDLEATTAAMNDYHELVADQVETNGGSLANFVGDSFMALFPDTRHALRAAISISSAAEARNEDVAEHRWVRFRMGMDLGPVTRIDRDYLGDTLNIAARIQAIAPAGGLAVSGRVYADLDEPALRFRPMGRQRLKNIPEQVDVYRFASLPSDGTGRTVNRSLALELPTIAVLPLHTEMVDDRVRSLAGMIRSDLVHRLARIAG